MVDAETVLGSIVLRKPKSLGRYDSYSGVVTSQRLIIAQMTSDMLKDAAQKARDDAKAEGKGFFGQWSDQLKMSFNFSQRYLTMEPSAILSEAPENFALNNDEIKELKLNLKNIRQGNTNLHEFEMEVVSGSGKYEFRMDEKDENVNLFKQVYGERVKMPFGYLSSHGFKLKLGLR